MYGKNGVDFEALMTKIRIQTPFPQLSNSAVRNLITTKRAY